MSEVPVRLPDVSSAPEPASPPLTSARTHFRAAVAARQQILQLWNGRSDSESFALLPRTTSSGTHEVWVRDDMPRDTAQKIDVLGRQFLSAIKATLDSAVHEAATVVSGKLWQVPAANHKMPLCLTEQEFDDLLLDGHLGGLRPDQVTELRALQPFNDTGSLEDVAPHLLLHLQKALEKSADFQGPLIATWVSSGTLEYWVPQGVTITEQASDSSGVLLNQHRLGTCLVAPPDAAADLDFVSQSALDLIFNAAPWPIDCDDNLSRRTQGLLHLCAIVIKYFDDSISNSTLDRWIGQLDASLPVIGNSPWLPIRPADIELEREIREGLAASQSNLAVHRDEQGRLILIRLQQGQLLGREIPQAAVPVRTAEDYGIDVENATLDVAAQYALPDFILRPTALRKGAGVREVGDGTILAGRLGLAVQVKARGTDPGDDVGEKRWLQKKAKAALKQGRGTIRTMTMQPALQLINLRGRAITIHGSEVSWAAVAVLDHPSPPSDVRFDDTQIGPGIVLLRRDWDFLWSQLKSAAAVVDYIHRIIPYGNVALGDETGRYYELADADERADPAPAEVAVALGGTPLHAPKLPQEPAGTSDQVGYDLFRQILEDIATSPFDADEKTRVDILGMIDRLDVGHRDQVGRLLLKRLDQCATVPSDALMSQNRTYIIDGGRLHLVFSIYSAFTGIIRDAYHSWLLLRRQEYLQAIGAAGEQLPWTVGVLLTPRVSGGRPWDTTVTATDGPASYSVAEHAQLRDFFASIGLDESPIV